MKIVVLYVCLLEFNLVLSLICDKAKGFAHQCLIFLHNNNTRCLSLSQRNKWKINIIPSLYNYYYNYGNVFVSLENNISVLYIAFDR